MQTVPIGKLSFASLTPLIGKRDAARLRTTLDHARMALSDRIIWHVNSTAQGGGIAEMLQTLLAYERGAGLDVRWLVIEGDPAFFALTKRLHHHLHGEHGDNGALGIEEQQHFTRVMQRNAEKILAMVRPRDVVILHDPQTVGLAPAVRQAGARVLWRCHIGIDEINAVAGQAWQFLRPHIEHTDVSIFSRAAYVPAWLAADSVSIIPPAIDALSVKNQPMDRGTVRAVLTHIGLLNGQAAKTSPTFARLGRVPGRIRRRAEIIQMQPLPGANVPLVVQVSRWDPLKDMLGVMRGFASYHHRLGEAHLALVGADPRSVTDDPESLRVFEECVAEWHDLPAAARERIHLVSLPMADIEENAIMVNAIQRFATVVVQKSLREGFGLTVTEALYKGRPVVASKVGGIQDQIVDGIHGLLIDDPTDSRDFGKTLARVLDDRALASRLGRNARRRAIAEFLAPRQFIQLLDLLCTLDGKPCRPAQTPKLHRGSTRKADRQSKSLLS